MKSTRNYWLDTLRGLAAIAVAIHHFNSHTEYKGHWFNEWTVFGARGVEVFFFISGFCVQAASYRARDHWQFLWQRFWRIYPPYLLSLFVVLGSAVVRKVFVNVNDAITLPGNWMAWIATITITTRPATPVPVMNWVYWTLPYEVMFYLVIGLTVAAKHRYLLLYVVTGMGFVETIRTIPGLFFLSHWAIFCFGLAFYEYWYGAKRHGVILMVVSIAQVTMNFSRTITVILLVTFVSVLISEKWSGCVLRRRTILSQCGDWSYSIYLLHVPLGVFCLYGAQQFLGMEGFPMNVVYIGALLVVTLFCSWISYHLVEIPAIRIGKAYAEMGAWLGRQGPFPNPFRASSASKGRRITGEKEHAVVWVNIERLSAWTEYNAEFIRGRVLAFYEKVIAKNKKKSRR